MRRVAVAMLLMTAGCGRWGFASGGSDGGGHLDGSSDADGPTDVAVDTGVDAAVDSSVDADLSLGMCTRVALTDNFDDGAMGAQWTLRRNNPVTVVESGGQLTITLADSMAGGRYGGYDSGAKFDFRDHCMLVTFVSVPNAVPSSEMDLDLLAPSGSLGFTFHAGTLSAFVNQAAFVSLMDAPYNPTQHKVLLVREDAGTLTWATSPDGVVFTRFVQAATPVDVSSSTMEIAAGTYASQAGPGTAVFDNYNLP